MCQWFFHCEIRFGCSSVRICFLFLYGLYMIHATARCTASVCIFISIQSITLFRSVAACFRQVFTPSVFFTHDSGAPFFIFSSAICFIRHSLTGNCVQTVIYLLKKSDPQIRVVYLFFFQYSGLMVQNRISFSGSFLYRFPRKYPAYLAAL